MCSCSASFAIYIVSAHLTNFENKFDIYTVNFIYSATVNCLILTLEMAAAVVFAFQRLLLTQFDI